MHRLLIPALAGAMITLSLSCAKNSQPQAGAQEVSTQNPTVSVSEQIDAGAQPTGSTGPKRMGLLLAMVYIKDTSREGISKAPARLAVLHQQFGVWRYEYMEDYDSNVFHKAMVYAPLSGRPGVLTAGGTRAILKLWRLGFEPEVIWEEDFGGKFSRLRDFELADVYGDGRSSVVVATHDQGVVAVVRPDVAGGYQVEELDRRPRTFVHEVEVGDLDGDGVLEIYATPSLPNKVDGSAQPGSVVRYVPAIGEGRTTVAELGERHAKEILVDDLDNDGRDELYVVVEAGSAGWVEIRRFDHDTPPSDGLVIATLPDTMCRFLTCGDIDGNGSKEMVAAAKNSGVWLLRPPAESDASWSVESVDKNSTGFEHAALLTDLNGDGSDELYVTDDRAAVVNQYQWHAGTLEKTTIHKYDRDFAGFTWNIMPVPVDLIPF